MSWHREPLAAFDVETTGADPKHDRIVTAAVSVVHGDRTAQHLSWLADPGIDIPAAATAIHGITSDRARAEGRNPVDVVDEITTTLADQLQRNVPIVAFRAPFDLTMLDREARRHGLPTLLDRVGGLQKMLVVDPFILDKHFDRFRRGKRTLGAVCKHYRVPLDELHAASADAFAAAKLAFVLGARFTDLHDMEINVLHRNQVAWAAEQAASLERYFRQRGRDERVDGAWPVILDGIEEPEPSVIR